mgnify:FL=1
MATSDVKNKKMEKKSTMKKKISDPRFQSLHTDPVRGSSSSYIYIYSYLTRILHVARVTTEIPKTTKGSKESEN